MYLLLQKMRNKIANTFDAIPLIRYQQKFAYQTAIAKHLVDLPLISQSDMSLVEKIKDEGVVITSLESLGIDSNLDILGAAKQLLPKIPPRVSGNKHEFVVHATSPQIIEYPEIFLWGLEQRLLNIVENYLGLPVAYNGVYFRRDIANQVEQTSRLWHIDKEDTNILKIIIYLHDVNEDTGPFQYIPQIFTEEISHALKYTSGYIQEQTMKKVISPSNYKSCLGSLGTVIFAATSNIFHRGKIPVNADRFTIFYDYSCRRQKNRNYTANSLYSQDLLLLTKNLPEHKKMYIYF